MFSESRDDTFAAMRALRDAPLSRRSRTPRQTATAVTLSAVFPGLGQLYNGEVVKAVLFFASGAALSWPLARAVFVEPLALIERGASPSVLLAASLLLGVWLWSFVDAWVGCRR